MKKFTYPKPSTLSKTHLNKVGDRIRKGTVTSADIVELDEWRASHLYPMNTFRVNLMTRTKNMKDCIVAQRLKRLPTIIQKLKYESDMELSRMQDVAGLRTIVKTNREVYELVDYYMGGKLSHPVKRFSDYIKDPKSSGYRSVHIVFEYKSTQSRNALAKEYDGLLLELQIRTELQHLWATSVEIAGLIRSQKLKNGLGSRDWLKFFKLTSELFAEIEAEDEPEILSRRLSAAQSDILLREMSTLDEKCGILEQLQAFSAGANVAINRLGRGGYVIIALDLGNHAVSLFEYPKKDYAKVIKKYAELEKDGKFTDQVLVSAGELKQLKGLTQTILST